VGRRSSPGLAWDWAAAAVAVVYALPAGVLAAENPSLGLALAVGVLPAAIMGVAPTRRARLAVIGAGVLIGVSMFVGGALASVPVLAVVAIALLGVVTAGFAARSRLALVAMTLSLPMVGVGLSYGELSEAAGMAALMVAGSAFACALSLLLPRRDVSGRAALAAPVAPTLEYGARLGAAGATAAAIGFALDLDHVGWVCAAALLVMRPAADMQRLRSVGRILAVTAGAFVAIALLRLDPATIWYGLAAMVAIAGAAATRRSRWYVTPAFTTFVVFLLLLYSDPDAAGTRLVERLGDTLLGVALAYVFGLALPALLARRNSPQLAGGVAGAVVDPYADDDSERDRDD
jgi:Fusaric acid resistance protein-like